MRKRNRGITIVISNLLLIAVVVCAVAGFYIFYNIFTKERQAESSHRDTSITIMGPTTAHPGDKVIMYIKNTGQVDLANWTFTSGLSDSGGALVTGSQRSVSADLSATGPWTFTVQAMSNGGDIVEDSWVIDEP